MYPGVLQLCSPGISHRLHVLGIHLQLELNKKLSNTLIFLHCYLFIYCSRTDSKNQT